MKPVKIAESVSAMNPVIKNVYDLLIAGTMSKKQIANVCSVDLDVVHTVAKKFRTGQVQKIQNDPEEKMALMKIDTVEESSDKSNSSHSRSKLSDDIILKIWELYDKGMPKRSISDELNISYSSVNRYVDEYNGKKEKHHDARKVRKVSTLKFSRYYNKYLKGEISRKEIMKKLDISDNTYYNYKKAYEEIHPQKKNASTEVEKQTETVSVSEQVQISEQEDVVGSSKFELKRITFGNNVVCGLVNGRHEMPVSLFIFDNISSEDMFNYNLQEEICKKFITDHIEFKDGFALSTMIVYTTGLQCALATLIKVTNEMKVNLIIYHYNSDNGKYVSQTIWDSFGNEMDNKYKFIENFVQNVDRSLYTYDSTIDELMNQQEIYIISQSKMERSTKRVLCRDRIFIKNYENLWNLYTSAIKSINKNTKDLMSVNIYKAEKQSDGKFAQTSRICSSYNI